MKTTWFWNNLIVTGLAASAALCGVAPIFAQQTSSDMVSGPVGPSRAAITSTQSSGWLQDTEGKHLGQTVDNLKFTVTNKTSRPVAYDFNNGQQFDLVVTDSNAKTVWTWSKKQMFTQLMTHLKLAPGDSHSYAVTWNRRDDSGKPVAPGTYTAVAQLQPMPKLMVARTPTVDASREYRDPTNVGAPSPSSQSRSTQSGESMQSDTTPPVIARTTITVPAQP